MGVDVQEGLDSLIDRWRAYAVAHDADAASIAAVEGHLRDHTTRLQDAGLDVAEAYLVALKRVAEVDVIACDFARVYADELWVEPAQGARSGVAATALVTDSGQVAEDEHPLARGGASEFWVMMACAIAAALAVKAPALFGFDLSGDGAGFFARNLSFFVLPFLAIYFIWKRALSRRGAAGIIAVFVGAGVFANAYPFASGGSTEVLTSIHLPIVLWLVVGVAYVAGEWRSGARRMEFVRFTGEWLITYALIALGGGVLVGITAGVFSAINLDVSTLIGEWILPCGAMGAVVVAAWLVVTRRNLVGGMAPMLARVFTPLFALMLVGLLGGVIWTRGVISIEREVLILFDLLLVVVLALLLYAISARDAHSEPDVFDRVQLVLVACALAVDVFALVNIAARLTEFGFSANRTVALGLNIILLINLAWSAFLQTEFVRSRRGFESVERWQMRYLPVYAAWAAIVVVVVAPLFRFA